MIGILASRADAASMNIARALVELETGEPIEGDLADRYRFDEVELVVVDALHLDLVDVDGHFNESPEWIAVVSKHAGETGPLLTAHFPGNIGTADYGGSPESVPPACPRALTAYLQAITDHAPDGYAVGIESTHHGPTDSDVPLMFVEIGSDEPQWHDSDAALAVATAVLAVRQTPATSAQTLIGLGGGHYAPRFERVIRETDWDVGHIAPEWALGETNVQAMRAVVAAMFTASDAEICLIDGEHPDLVTLVEDLGYRVVSERWLRATSQVDEAVLDALEEDLAPLGDGLVLGSEAIEGPETFDIVDLSPELLMECASIDLDRTIDTVETNTVAYVRGEDGAHPGGRLAIADMASLTDLIDELESILLDKYDSVSRGDDGLIATRRSFDPAAAAKLGVPQGPLFGRLESGESIEVDGRTIHPEEVIGEQRVTYALPPDV